MWTKKLISKISVDSNFTFLSYARLCVFHCSHRLLCWIKSRVRDRGVTGIFFWGGKVIFPDFFPGVKCFFPVENSHFGRPKTNFRRFQKWKAKKKKKKKKKKVLTSFSAVFLLPFPIFHLFFSIFTPFPFFPCLFFPDTSAKISRSEVSGGALCPPCPPACYATGPRHSVYVKIALISYWNDFSLIPFGNCAS